MRFVVTSSVLAVVVACSSSSTTTSSTTKTNSCCINLRFYDCEDGCSTTCPRAADRDEECGGKPSASSSSSSSGTSGSPSSTSSSSGDVTPKKRGDDCTCDKHPTAEADVYAQCTGNVSGCNTLDLACLYEYKSGEGNCVVSCSPTGKACPSGLTCLPTSQKDLAGQFWNACQ